jgi:hypothetical protein
VSAQRARNGPSVTTASATGGSRPGQLLRDLDASAELARRERFATVPITRTNSTARSHSRLAASTLRPLRWRRSDARRPPGRDFSFQPRVLRRVCLGPRPASGCGGFGSSRGGSAVPTSPSAGLLPIGAGPDGDRSLKHHFPVGSSPARGRAAVRLSQLVTRRRRRLKTISGGPPADEPLHCRQFLSGRYWARTSDLLLVRQALYQLS